jgi:hypothetical protein
LYFIFYIGLFSIILTYIAYLEKPIKS